jgi:signal transduction histidine kinase/DNA-binding response OmpR family regulator
VQVVTLFSAVRTGGDRAITATQDLPTAADYIAGRGEMAELVRCKDWSRTPLGAIDQWPQSLRTVVSLCLASNFPINIIWGPEHTQIYNDGYRVVCGDAHPTALGQGYHVTWASAWPAIGQPFARARAGETSFLENQRMFLTRNGYLEETFFTFSLSPIRAESGGTGGLFHPVTETTAMILAERRTRALRDLTARLGQANEQRDLAAQTLAVLSDFGFDLPFALVYALDGDRGVYRLQGQHGVAPGTEVSPTSLVATAPAPWPIRQAAREQRAVECLDVDQMIGDIPCGPYEEPPARAFVLPVSLPDAEHPPIIIVLGVSPRLPFDEAYRGFYDLVLVTLSAALARVHALEDERRRAAALAELDRAKTVFFSNVSHEFRTPLTLMLGPIEDALHDAAGLSPGQTERLEVVHRNALRLLRLVNTLLDFSRIEAGRVRACFEPTDLGRLTAELAANFHSACARAGLTLEVDCPLLSRPVHVDRDMWEKIVLNLISNAFKFTLAGGIVVSLHESGVGVELVVRDTGIGIASAELPRVFERFHRIEGRRGRSYEGTGIGLSLVQELVRLHDGAIVAESTEGEGTTFRVTIPFGAPHMSPRHRQDDALDPTAMPAGVFVEEAMRWVPDQPRQPIGSAQAAPERPFDEARPRILIADDNADMRAYVRRILEDGGYLVEAVADGSAALAAARRQPPPDLILSDVMMPSMDGFALLKAIRTDPSMDAVLVVLLSARAGEEAKLEGLAAGADDYLVKPFGGRELVARIDAAIRLSRQRREAADRESELQTRLATAQNQAALRERDQQLELALKAGRLEAWELDIATGRFRASETVRAAIGFGRPEDHNHQGVLDAIGPADLEVRQLRVAEAINNGTDLDLEYRIVRPDGEIGWILLRGRATYAEDGTPKKMAGVSLDITERKRGEERQRILLAELNHRVKNTLTVVQSIARQTRRYAEDPPSFDQAFASRIHALARAHDLLTRTAWDGVFLADVISQSLADYLAPTDANMRVSIDGPPIRLGPNAAVTLTMAFHELTMNAARYGALSVAGGVVEITWSVDRSKEPVTIDLVWSERGGAPVSPPAHDGFGFRLIKTGIPRELGGSVVLDFVPAGMVCRMHLSNPQKMAVLG